MRLIVALSLLLSTLTAFTVHMQNDEVVRGTTAFIELSGKSNIHYLDFKFKKKKIPVFEHPFKKGSYFALIPVSYYESAGVKKIKLEYLKIKKYQKMIKFVYQNKPKGTGDAILKCRNLIKGKYFLLLLQ